MKKIKIIIICIFYIALFLFFAEYSLRHWTTYGVEYFVVDNNTNTAIFGNVAYDSGLAAQMKDMVRECKKKKNIKQAGVYRILVLGDSVARGGELKPGELGFPWRVQNILQKKYPQVKFELFVLAVGGWSTPIEVGEFKKYASCFNPDLVILSYCHNDTAEVSQATIKKGKYYIGAFYKTGIVYLPQVPFNRYCTQRFLVVRLINGSIINLAARLKIPLYAENYVFTSESIHQGFKELATLTQYAATPVLVVVFPYLEKSFVQNRRDMSEHIKKWSAELCFYELDLSEAFSKYPYTQLQCTPNDPCHPNTLGHQIATEEIVQKIEKEVFKDHMVGLTPR